MADYLKIPEVARRLDISEKTARRYVKAGVLPSTFIGGAYRVTEEDLEEFIHRSEVKPEAPKAERRSPSEPSFNDVLAEERLAKVPEVLGEYITARMERHEAELEAPDSPYFRTASDAAKWLAGVEQEFSDWTDWAMQEAVKIMPTPRTEKKIAAFIGAFADAFAVVGVMLAFHNLKDHAERRIKAMNDVPDAVTARRLEKAEAAAQASMERLEEFQKAANG